MAFRPRRTKRKVSTMIDILRDILAAQEQIAESLQDGFLTIAMLLVFVAFLLIMLIAGQCQTRSVLKSLSAPDVQRTQIKGLTVDLRPIHRKRRKRRKKRRNVK